MIGNRIPPFKFWCQKVLPTVYDDSLSYYEVLNRVTQYLNDVITQMNALTESEEAFQQSMTNAWETYSNNLTDEWVTYKTELTAIWEQYKTYIDTYFDDLDVQEEINNKLDEMVEDGTLDSILLPFFNAYTVEINNQMRSLEARMDSFTHLAEGSTTGDAELIDGRNPASGYHDNLPYNNIGNAIRGQVKDLTRLNSDVTNMVAVKNYDKGVLLANSRLLFVKAETNTQPSTGGILFSENSSYDTYYYIIEKSGNIFFNKLDLAPYTSICHGTNCTSVTDSVMLCSNPVRYRTTDNNLPSQKTPLEVSVGDCIAITVSHNYNIKVYGLDYVLEYSSDFANGVNWAIDDTKNGVDYIIKKNTDGYIIQGDETHKVIRTSCAIDNNEAVRIDPNNNYNSWIFMITHDTNVYFDNDVVTIYTAIAHGSNVIGNTTSGDYTYYYCKNPVRLRNTENNLPTALNPIEAKQGDIIVITGVPSESIKVYGLDATYEFTDTAKSLIRAIQNDNKSCIVEYDDTVVGNITERLYIYKPCGKGYVKYDFAHTINNEINADIWNIQPLYAVNDDLTNRYAISTTGEFECALRIYNTDDFIGGTAHGDEIVTAIKVFIDGAEVSPNSINADTTFNVLRIVEISNMYSPSDHETLVAVHGKEYIFTRDKLTLNQSVIWKGTYSVTTSYMAMLPVAKTVTDKITTNDDYEIRSIPPTYFSKDGITSALSWSGDIGFSAKFSIPHWDINGTNLSEVGKFICTDNGGLPYNKQYYVCTSGGSVSSGTMWRTTTEYEFEINK